MINNKVVVKWLPLLFKEKTFCMMTLLIIVHQTLIAASIFFLTMATVALTHESVSIGANFFLLIAAYLFCVYSPYAVGCWSNYWAALWNFRVVEKTLGKFDEIFVNKPSLLNEVTLRKKVVAVYSNRTNAVVSTTTDYTHNVLSLFFNSALSVLALAWLLSGWFAIAYLFSFCLCIVMIRKMGDYTKKSSSAFEHSSIKLTSWLSSFWPNMVPANALVQKSWLSEKEKIWHQYEHDGKRNQKILQTSNFLLSSLILLPSMAVIVFLIYRNLGNVPYIAALLVNTQRVLGVLNSMSSLVYSLIEFSDLKGKLNILKDSLISAELPDIESRVSLEKITITGLAGQACLFGNDIRAWIEALPKTGRYTVRGDNGAGKSSLLILIHQLKQ